MINELGEVADEYGIHVPGSGVEICTDALGCSSIMKMHKGIKMEEQLDTYDLVIINYWNQKLSGTEVTEATKQIF